MKQDNAKKILEALVAIAACDFNRKFESDDPSPEMVGIFLAINMLAEELNRVMNEIKSQTEELHHLNHKLEELVEQRTNEVIASARMAALGQMAGGIAHEINNPLAIIFGKTKALAREIAKSSDRDCAKEQKLIGEIQSTSMRMSKIIKGLKSFSRDGSNDPFEQVELNTLLNDVIAVCTPKIMANDINLKLDIKNSNINIECRATQIGQVLINLVNNACDAILSLSEKWIELKISEDSTNITFSVTDSGNGIPKDIQEKMLDPFFTTKPVGQGTGLGLSVSKGLIEKHSGSLYIDNTHSHTRFVVSIPKKQFKQL